MSDKDQFTIDGRSFLHFFYDINTYEDMLNWLESNNSTTVTTKYRLVDYSFMLYNNKNIVINDDIVNVYINYYKQNKHALFDVFNEYITKTNGKYKLNKKKHQTHETNKLDVCEFINSNIITPSVIYDFLDMIKNTYNTIDINSYEFQPLEFMLNMLVKFILAKIK